LLKIRVPILTAEEKVVQASGLNRRKVPGVNAHSAKKLVNRTNIVINLLLAGEKSNLRLLNYL
jgi:hypothetical protein